MSSATSPFYITGGALPLDAPSYVERQADRGLYDALQRGEFCYLLTARQMGKSSLVARTAARLRADGVVVATLDLTGIGQNLTVEQWYDGLLRQIGQQVGLEDELEDFWLEQSRLSPFLRWMTAIRRVVLPAVTERDEWRESSGEGTESPTLDFRPPSLVTRHSSPVTRHPSLVTRHSSLVIFIDEVDAVRSLPFSTDEFFAGIRECYNRRPEDPLMERLSFCLVGVATPSDLIQDVRTTPFNIGQRIELTDFSAAEAAPLAAGLSTDGRDGKKLLQRILYWTDGHPYLTQRLCRAVAEANENPQSAIRNPQSVDRLCEGIFLSKRGQETDDNLAFVRNRLLRVEKEEDLASLLDLYAQIRVRGKPVPHDEGNPRCALLRLSGIVRVVEGVLRVRNRIYAQVFNREWIHTNMPDAEVRRQKAAFRRGVLRATAIATVILAIIGTLAVVAFNSSSAEKQQRQRADAERNRAEHLLYISDMNVAQKAYEENNLGLTLELLDRHHQDEWRGFEWGYWWRMCHLDLRTLQGHTGPVWAVAYSPDGKQIVTGSEGRTAKVWEAETGREILTLRDTGPVWAVAYSPDGKYIVTGSGDQTAKVWEAQTGRMIRILKGHTSGILRAAFSPDGRRIVTGSEGGVKVWEAQTGRELPTLKLKEEPKAISPDGLRIVTPGPGSVGKVWEAQTGQEILTLEGHTSRIIRAAFSPDGRRIATTTVTCELKVWEAQTGGLICNLQGPTPNPQGHISPIFSMAFSPDGRRIVTGSLDTTAKVWEVQTGRELLTLKGHTGFIESVAFSPDGKYIVTGSDDNTAKVWEARTSRATLTLTGPKDRPGYIYSVAFSPDGRRIVTGSADHTAKVWEAQTGRELLTLKGRPIGYKGVAFSPDGHWIVTGSADKTAKVWEAHTRRLIHTLQGHKGAVLAVAFSPDSQRIVTGSEDYTAKVWDTRTGRTLLTIQAYAGYKAGLASVAFSPEGRRIVTGRGDIAQVWEARTGREILTLTGHKSEVRSVAFSPDGRWILTGSADGTAKVWEAQSGQVIQTIRVGTILWSAAFSPDGSRIVTGGENMTAKVWESQTGQELLTLKGHTGWIMSAVFSPDGRKIVTGSTDGTAKVWAAAPYRGTVSVRAETLDSRHCEGTE